MLAQHSVTASKTQLPTPVKRDRPSNYFERASELVARNSENLYFEQMRLTSMCADLPSNVLSNIVHRPSSDFGFELSPHITDSFFRLNIGGKSYRIRSQIILDKSDNNSLMSALIRGNHADRLQLVDAYIQESQEYYLERNTKFADIILDYYITGLLHKPPDTCVQRFKEELNFWNLSYEKVAPCCSILPTDHKETKRKRKSEIERLKMSSCGKLRSGLYRIVEVPGSSLMARLFAILSVFFVFASVVGLVLGSMPEFQEDLTNVSAYHLLHSNRRRYDNPEDDELLTTLQKQYPDFVYKPTDRPVAHLLVVEYICMAWFTIEYFLRFLISLNKLEFIRQPLNVIDLLTIVPFYLELCLPFLGINADKLKELSGAMMVIRIIRVLRMTRMFKLARYSTTLQTFGHTFRSSITELSMLIMFLVTGILFFSTILYFLEKDEINSQFKSIPAACWWCVVTMTTIGYGDSVPHTAGGKLLATLASICGIIALAFPISMIVEKFATAQQKILQLQPLNKVRIPTVDNEDLQRDWIDSVHRKLAVT